MAEVASVPNSKEIMVVIKEPGVADLKERYGIRMAGYFAKAIVEERNHGATTPLAMDHLNKAIELETAALGM
jgi:hypothetical protein